jgi:hypothetical protein
VHHAHQLAPSVAFLHLAVDQAWLHLPSAPVASSTTQGKPLAKVGGERIKVAIEPVTGKQWDATRRQPLLESMDEPMGHGLGAGAELKRRKNLGEGIDRQPEPENLIGAAEPGAQFIQLQVGEVEIGEEALVQGLRVLASTG